MLDFAREASCIKIVASNIRTEIQIPQDLKPPSHISVRRTCIPPKLTLYRSLRWAGTMVSGASRTVTNSGQFSASPFAPPLHIYEITLLCVMKVQDAFVGMMECLTKGTRKVDVRCFDHDRICLLFNPHDAVKRMFRVAFSESTPGYQMRQRQCAVRDRQRVVHRPLMRAPTNILRRLIPDRDLRGSG